MGKTFKNFIYLITFVLFCILSASCEKDISDTSQPPGTETVNVSVLGKKLENPYSVMNMQKALNNLLNNLKEGEYEIIPSHYYVKFKPQNDDELSLLKNDTTIYLYQYPLDVEIIEGSLTYQDPEVPHGQPTYQYASVPANYVFPAVAHEILEELFIPEDTTGSKAGLPVPVEDLVTEALRITNNLEPGYNAKASWRPAGTMLVWDTTLEISVPVKHLKVKARRWFTTYEGITNQSGYYSCNGTFNGPANYSLQFERYDFEIRDGWLSTANINGPKRNFNWNLYMKGGKQEFWATIFRATSHYYYDDIHGLRRPPQNSFWNTQLKLRAMYESNSNNGTHCPSCRFLGLGSAIKIYNPQNFSMEIYGTTIHEIAHASHWKMDSFTYGCQNDDNCAVQCCLGDLKVAESWARGVQWELTRIIYPPNIMGNYPDYTNIYTGIVQDMIDGISENDQVSGYTIEQIEDALPGQTRGTHGKRILKTYTTMQQKTIWTLFLIFGISVLFNSCSTRDIDTIKNVTYIYKNGTAYDLVLEVYDNGVKFKSFSISPNKEVETGTTRAEGPVPFLFYEPTMKYGDSVVIRFSNTRCLSYARNSGVDIYGDKIFDYREYDNYTPDLVEKNKFTLYYTITVDDYNESVDCE